MLVRELKSGEHFGELALINNEKRSLSIRVGSDTCSLLRLDRETFIRILGSIQAKLKKDYNREFDGKMEQLKNTKRTMSLQAMDNVDFKNIREENNGSCNTILQADNRQPISDHSDNSFKFSGNL